MTWTGPPGEYLMSRGMAWDLKPVITNLAAAANISEQDASDCILGALIEKQRDNHYKRLWQQMEVSDHWFNR